jgi:hypothetical protein
VRLACGVADALSCLAIVPASDLIAMRVSCYGVVYTYLQQTERERERGKITPTYPFVFVFVFIAVSLLRGYYLMNMLI